MQRSARFIGPALRTGLSALLLATAGCTGAHEGSATGSADPPTADQVPVADLRADFDALYAGLRDAHFDLYARRDRDAYEARYRAMRAGFDHPLTPLQARIAFQRFVAYGNVAHARIDPPLAEWERFRTGGGKAFPLFVRVQGGQAWIIDGTRGLDAVEPGDRLLSVDGVPALAWLERLRVHLSADNDYMAWAQLERQLPLLAWLEFGERPMFQIEVAKPDDRRISLALPARARGEPVTTHTAGVPARFELDANTREARMLADGIAYLRPGPFYDNRPQATHPWDPTDFRGFLDAAFADMLARGATRLLIDLRDNPGGDNSFSDPMIAWFADRPFRFSNAFEIRVSDATIHSNRRRLDAQGAGDPDSTSHRLADAYAGQAPGSVVRFPIPMFAPRSAPRFEGDVYVLVNRHTYSNATLVAAIVQDFGFGRVLGEETSDLASTYGAMESFTLPRTGLEVGYPKARILRPNGDPVARGVVPDLAIATPVSSDTDVVLQEAIELIRQRPGPSMP